MLVDVSLFKGLRWRMDLPGNSSIPKTALYLLLACEGSLLYSRSLAVQLAWGGLNSKYPYTGSLSLSRALFFFSLSLSLDI